MPRAPIYGHQSYSASPPGPLAESMVFSGMGMQGVLRRRFVSTVSMLAIVLAAAAVIGCAIQRHRAHVRDGLLMRGLHRDAFLAEWGLPKRTSTMTGEDVISAGWSTYGGAFFKGKAVYDVWEYGDPEVVLFFNRARLVGWRTDATVGELQRKQ